MVNQWDSMLESSMMINSASLQKTFCCDCGAFPTKTSIAIKPHTASNMMREVYTVWVE